MKILYFLFFAAFLQLCNAYPSIKPIFPYNSKIINGEQAQVGGLPHQLMMETKRQRGFVFSCGAVLINKLQALTAAHCVVKMNVKDVRLYAGLHNRAKKLESQEIFVRKITISNAWSDALLRGDMAILTFTAPVTFNDNVQPIEWNDDPNETFAGEKCIISGWGITQNGMRSDTLQKAEIDVISNDECRRRRIWGEDVYEGHVCIFHRTFGVCFADSGGPLTCHKDGKPILVGVLSWTDQCNTKFPSGYERTSYFKQFISENLIEDEIISI